ncbi:hypothetical protein DSAG12_00823 [Promethearchaeum syntrophicum]|uniref:Uncharacterized protein n=1 Tax=Promethearchaeum syntrophicum TaxID=2594042 RepID=A0A5B9D8B8_9ARCH|nr:hypothetical protein [Candidatus Prometheoarchaeum syntrophicum]QEE15000.1 hypothetical protein DSAG12_00823 [Candidatus Prometheoarchaeum syntrophicum]
MTQEDYIQRVLEGGKPAPALLEIAQDEINKLDLPLGEEKIIMGEKHPIKNVCDAINLMRHMAALEVTLALLQIDVIRGRHKEIFDKVKYLITYWYARGWIEPLLDYGKPLIKAKKDSYLSGNYLKQYLMGAKADQATIEMIRSYMDFTMINLVFSGEPGPFKMNIHGAGPISRHITPVKRFFQLIKASGAKMAKEYFNLRNLNNEREIQRLYDDSFHVLLFWTMKGWLKLPDLDGKALFNMIKEPEEKIQKAFSQFNKKNLPNYFDFGFDFLSNEEICSRFDNFRLKTSNKNNLINELSAWINGQAKKRGYQVPYPHIYQKTNEYVQLFF